MNRKNLILPIMGIVAATFVFSSCEKNEDSVPVPVSGSEANHDYVDYGFTFDSIRVGIDTINNVRVDTVVTRAIYFAICNIGATNPQDNGDYFAWGETETKSSFSYDNYFDKVEGDSTAKNFTKYNDKFKTLKINGKNEEKQPNFVITIGTTTESAAILESSEDAATVQWGNLWKIPTSLMWKMLQTECYWVWTSGYNGSNQSGYIVYKAKSANDRGKNKNKTAGYTSLESYSMNDQHIFLPAGGRYVDNKCQQAGTDGCYWVANMSDSEDYFAPGMPVGEASRIRYHGRLVRPVCCPIIDTKTIEVEIK